MYYNYVKIDLHLHTFATKKNESVGRNCPSPSFFAEKLFKADVKLCAITNHNYFDNAQYESYKKEALKSDIVVFPGVEVDVELLSGNVGHCLVIANPNEVTQFNAICNSQGFSVKENADSYRINIKNFVECFKSVDCIFIVHYGSKSKHFDDADIKYLKDNCGEKIVMVEPSNLISAFIYLANNKNSLVGSDLHDWKTYPEKELPSLKIDVADYDKLKLLFKKDEEIIETILNTKNKEIVTFVDETFTDLSLSLPIYNDINIIFGGKSTGKSIIIKDILSYYENKGLGNKISYYCGPETQEDFNRFISFCPDDERIDAFVGDEVNLAIEKIKSSTFIKCDNIFKNIEKYLTSKDTDLAKKIGFVECNRKFAVNEQQFDATISAMISDYDKLTQITFSNYSKYLDEKDYESLLNLINLLKTRIINALKDAFVKNQSLKMANNAIRSFKNAYTNNKGKPTKPNSTGVFELFVSINTFINNNKLLYDYLNKEENVTYKKIGVLDKKGVVRRKEIITSNPSKVNGKSFKWLSGDMNKTNLGNLLKESEKSFFKTVDYSSFVKHASNLRKLLVEYNVKNGKDLVATNYELVLEDDKKADPSTGEKSVLMMGAKLFDDKDIYIFDEPELSVGHDYVNRVIIDRLKELSKEGKTVIISTHDANIAVRTLPYTCIYREESNDGTYNTYIGNPFTGILKEVSSGTPLSWKEQTINTLEGGSAAFEEREAAYGE